MPIREMIRLYGAAKPPARLDAHGVKVCLSCPRPVTSTSNNARFCTRCGEARSVLLRKWRIANARPQSMQVETKVLDKLILRNRALQSALLRAVSEFRESRADGDAPPPRWVADLSDAAKGVEAVIYTDIEKVVRRADRIASATVDQRRSSQSGST